MPGQPDDVLTIFFGYGRKRAGKIADGVGFNTYALRDSDATAVVDPRLRASRPRTDRRGRGSPARADPVFASAS